MSTLTLQLVGLQSYGTNQSMERVRDTGLEPSKSAVVGMLCGAIGKDRNSDGRDGLPPLAEFCKLKMGVRVDREGQLRTDYQTATGGVIASDGSLKDTACFVKYYLADAAFLVGMEGPQEFLERLLAGLQNPVWAPCLGRRGCVPAKPVWRPDSLKETPLLESLRSYGRLVPAASGQQTRFVLEVLPGAGTRRVADVPLRYGEDRKYGMREVKEWSE